MTWTCKGCGFHTVAISPDAEAHRCGNSGTWERCTCGSGGHPRECELHPEAYAAHCAELDAIAAETDEEGRANLAAELAETRERRRAWLRSEMETCTKIADEMLARVSKARDELEVMAPDRERVDRADYERGVAESLEAYQLDARDERYEWLGAEIATVKRMLAELAPSRVLERLGFECRLVELEAEMKSIENEWVYEDLEAMGR